MVAFGKKLKASQIQEWQRYYINYKLLKKKVNHYSRQIENGEGDHAEFLNDFSWMLDIQIEKTVLFIIEQQGLLANRLSHLRQQQYVLDQRELVPNFAEMEEDYRVVGRDLLKLLFFVELNATGLRKILKKFDKRFGYKFTNYYVKTRANHPYSQLQQVFKHVGFGAVLGAISRNLNDLQDNHGSFYSIYDLNALPMEDSVVISIKEAIDRLTHTTNVLQFVGQHALILQEDTLSHDQDAILDQEFHFPSLLLNLTNTYLYMVNTYIIVPTADNYSLSLGAAATVCGAVIGSMAVAQMFSSVYFSAWSNRSYFRPLVFSSVALFIGNVLYACAYDLNSISVLLIGRLFCGLGSARAVNRRYISDCVPLKMRLKASAGFVSASALGMASGPALACLFQTKFKVYKLTVNQDTLPGWFMALAWLVYLFCLWFAFKEPPHLQRNLASEDSFSESSVENGLKSPLILHSTDKIQDGDKEENGKYDDNDSVSHQFHRPATSILAAYKLLTPSIKVQLLIYFMLKYALEIVLAESSVITSHYFVWSNQSVAIFLACLGLTVLPVNVIVGNYISNMFEERQVLLASEIVLCIGIILSFNTIIPYSVPQYVCSALITFVAAEVLEGVNLSLLSRVMSSRLSRGTYNGGLLSTEAGTLARVIADGMITLAGYWGQSRLLNITLFPCLCICVMSIIATFSTYNSLY